MTATTSTDTLATETRIARFVQMDAYRDNRQPRANDNYLPFPIDALGLYRITGPIVTRQGNPLDGFYAHDDFGQLVRVPFETVLAILN